jgi:phosphatidate cytidylyltransferase
MTIGRFMDGNPVILTLFLGVVGVLILATLVGAGMTARHGRTPALVNFNSRTQAWWGMVAVLGVAFATGKPGTILLFGAASAIALSEFLKVSGVAGNDRWAVGAAYFVVLPIQYFLVWDEWYGLFSIFISVYCFLLLPILVALRGSPAQFLSRVSELQWGLMLAVFCLSHVPALLLLSVPGFEGQSILLVAFLILVVETSDVMQYVWGKLIGRHRIVPVLSPSKTWEGLVGGVGTAMALGTALWWATPFTPVEALGISFVITAMGFFGGLVMSAIKRDRGVKDWGQIIPGHGGVLDRLDSVLFAAPVYFHIIRYWWSG